MKDLTKTQQTIIELLEAGAYIGKDFKGYSLIYTNNLECDLVLEFIGNRPFRKFQEKTIQGLINKGLVISAGAQFNRYIRLKNDVQESSRITTALIEGGLANGGCTVARIDQKQVDFNNGYIVGAIGGLRIEGGLKKDDVETIKAWITSHSDWSLFGSWLDNGILYIDKVEHCCTRDFALDIARTNNELAIWDCANQCEIEVTTDNK